MFRTIFHIIQKHPWAITALLLTLVSLSPVLDAGWVNWDDNSYVTQNTAIKEISFGNMLELFHPRTMVLDTYTPLTQLSFMLEYAHVGTDPWLYHLNNLLLHLANTLLVYILIYLLSKAWLIAFWAAVLFGIHPMHVESVAWVSERKDVLFAFFFLASAVWYIRMIDRGRQKRQPYIKHPSYWGCLLLFTLSMLAKPQAISLPLVLILFDYWKRRPLTTALVEKWPFYVVSVIFLVITFLYKFPDKAIYTLTDRILYSSYAGCLYLLKFLWPVGLSCIHPFPQTGSGYPLFVWLSLPVLLALAVLTLVSYRKYPYLFFGGMFFWLNIGHTLHIFKVNSAIIYERFTYLPYIGLCWILGWGVWWVYQKFQPAAVKIIIPLLLVVTGWCGWQSFRQAKVWENDETLWSNVIYHYPDEFTGYFKRGLYYEQAGFYAKALSDLDKALQIEPTNAFVLNNLGLLYFNRQQYDTALPYFDRAIATEQNDAKAFVNRGITRMNLGQLEGAQQDLNHAIRLDPGHALAYMNRGFLYQRKEMFSHAIKDFSRAAALQPDLAPAFYHRGKEYYYAKNWDAAVKDLKKAIQLRPGNGEAYYWLSKTFLAMGYREEAVTNARKALAMGYRVDPEYLRSLGLVD